MVYFVYILLDKRRDRFYIGQTADLEDRLGRHLSGRSRYTKTGIWRLVYKEKFKSRKEAVYREKYIKSWKSKKMIRSLIKTAGR